MLTRSGRLVQKLLLRNANRMNSSLLIPLQQKADVPAEIEAGFPRTKAWITQCEAEYTEFNNLCDQQYEDMISNKIENVKSRGGIDGWAESNDELTRTFEFNTFEQAQAFCQIVGKCAEAEDHHPEWSAHGTNVSVRLTSHFANNTVTIKDYELAEKMNLALKNSSSFSMYDSRGPSNNQLLSLSLGLGGFVIVASTLSYIMLDNNYSTADQRGKPIKQVTELPADTYTAPQILASEVQKNGIEATIDANIDQSGAVYANIRRVPKNINWHRI